MRSRDHHPLSAQYAALFGQIQETEPIAGTYDASPLTGTDPLCRAQHNGSYVESRIMLSSGDRPVSAGRFLVMCPT